MVLAWRLVQIVPKEKPSDFFGYILIWVQLYMQVGGNKQKGGIELSGLSLLETASAQLWKSREAEQNEIIERLITRMWRWEVLPIKDSADIVQTWQNCLELLFIYIFYVIVSSDEFFEIRVSYMDTRKWNCL